MPLNKNVVAKERKQRKEFVGEMAMREMQMAKPSPRYKVVNRVTGQVIQRMTLEEFSFFCAGNRAALKQFVLVKGDRS